MRRVLLCLLSVAFCAGCLTTGEGEKVGVITKVAREGPFCPTWEAAIIRGWMQGGSGAFGPPFDFTIESQADVDVLKLAMVNGDEVRITYRTEAATFCRSNSNDHFLTSVSVIRKGR